MSFSSSIKQELNKNSDLVNKKMVEYELIGYLISDNTNIIDEKEMKFSTESDYNINRFSKLLLNLNINHDIDIIGKSFVIYLKKKDIKFINQDMKEIYLKEEIEKSEENLRAIVRGCFMGSGSVNNPEKEYHLEIEVSNKENLGFLENILKKLNIKVKILIVKNKYSLYIKEAEEISKLLALIGANKAVMEFEDIRIQKEMRGKVNRLVNCETANLNKTINASIEQISAIEKLKALGKFYKLDDGLKEIAILRLENPNVSLTELGKLLEKPIGKSGVNYRLKKIIDVAKDL